MQPANGDVPVPGGGGAATILVVDDEAVIRNLVHCTLTRLGYHVLMARDGLEALNAIESHEEIDLLITDAVMPEMGGYELMERVSYIRPSLKMLYISGYTQSGLTIHGVTGEATAFLPKPFEPEELVDKVRELLGSGK